MASMLNSLENVGLSSGKISMICVINSIRVIFVFRA
jgi:hypothetical protein